MPEHAIYTDGSALRNPHGPAGWAWFCSDTSWAAGGFTVASNQVSELFAVLAALRSAPRADNLNILSDSAYAIGCSSTWLAGFKRRGWTTRDGQPVANLSLIQNIDRALAARTGKTRFTKVKGHSGIPGNERADVLAGAATRAIAAGEPVASGPGWR